ncbi:MAG TPA: hypothetical protein VMR98_06025, partial [Candidatus Polarisedimenticolaceae bacterium]|nr:hypothetical protein [Candidatus Polarisedimenticolaceae bacterium]
PSIGFVAAAVNAGIGAFLLMYFWKQIRGLKWLLVLMLVVSAGGLWYGHIQGDTWSKSLTQGLYDDPIVMSEQTRYQNLVLTRSADSQNPDMRLYINGNLQFSSLDEKIYHENLVHPAMTLAPHRNRVLILGGGDGLAVREVVKYRDVKSITLVDLDPDMIRIASTNKELVRLNGGAFKDARVTSSLTDASLRSGVRDSGHTRPVILTDDSISEAGGAVKPQRHHAGDVHVYNVDAFKFVNTPQKPYDVVIVDLPDPNGVELAKLYSREFYAHIRRLMSPQGIMVVQSSSPYHSREAYVCIMKTIRDAGFPVIPYHENVPSFGDWGWTLAWNGTPSQEMQKRINGLDKFPVKTRYLIDASTWKRTLTFGKGWLDEKGIEVSTLLNPSVMRYYVYRGQDY